MLKYKTKWCGIRIVEIGKFAPSSQLCSCCGHQNKELTLDDREWICSECKIIHDRDINAVKNIKNMVIEQIKIGRFTTELTDVESSANKDARRIVKGVKHFR